MEWQIPDSKLWRIVTDNAKNMEKAFHMQPSENNEFEIMEPYVENLVVDSGGFIKLVKLEQIGKNIFTIDEVVAEIKDAATKERLEILPYELNYLNPTAEELKHVTEFSKKTGDYPSLSATDLRLIASVYHLESKVVGVDHLKKSPQISKTLSTTKKIDDPPTKLAGFYFPAKDSLIENTLNDLKLEENESADESDENETENNNPEPKEDEGGWITPSNIDSIKLDPADRDPVTVACLSTDFAVQNVLLHMGLRVIAADGMLVKRLKTWILRCYACLKTTSIMTKKFCPECGNQTLKRVSVTVNEDGKMEYFISKRRTINTKGNNASIPLPKGGKHSNNPIVCEDQPMPENRLSKKALQKLNVLDEDYLARDSPFLIKDVHSRSAVIGIRSLAVNKNSKKRSNKKK